MNTAELINSVAYNPPSSLRLGSLRKRIAQVRIVIRFISGFIQEKDDAKMLRNFMKAQERAHDLEIFKRAQVSHSREKNDIEAVEDYLLPLYQAFTPKRYDVLIFQALREEITWFIYPLFLEAIKKYPWDPDKVIHVFRDSVQTLNLLWKSVQYNQAHEDDSQIFLSWDKIEASEELKKVAIGKAGWCPLMRVKTVLHGTLMTDFMITCVKFWTYRKVLQNHN